MTTGSALLVPAAAAFLAADSLGPLLILGQVVQGIAFVFAFNAGGALVADLAPPARLTQAMGLYGAANLLMNAIAPAAGELLADRVGWWAVFVASMVAATLAAGLSRLIAEPAPHPRAEVGEGGSPLSRPLLLVYLVGFATAVTFATLLVLHQPFALERGVTEVKSFFIGFTLSALVVRLGMGGFADRVGPLRIALVSMAFYALTPAALYFLGPERLFLVGVALGFCHGALYPAMTALAIERCAPGSRGMVLSLFNGAFNGGIAGASVALGWVAQLVGYGPAFGSSSAVTLLGLAALIGLAASSRAGSLPRARQ